MKANKSINRREFLRRGAIGSAAAGLGLAANAISSSAMRKAPASSDGVVRVGYIGVGSRIHQIIEEMKKVKGFKITGLCDAYKGRIERALERVGSDAKVYSDYKEMLKDKTIDAVVIGTPDHWHKVMCIDAVEAGKDVYCEKPLTYRIEEGPEVIKAVKKTGQILQVGSQGMSTMVQMKAREMIQSGKLGQVTMIRASYNRNTASGAWIYPIPPDASPRTVNWDMFLGSAPKRSFDLERFFQWRCYRDYSGGNSTDLFVHLCTTIHYIMNAKVPSMVCAQGQLYRWKDSRDVPDTVNGIMEYPEGFVVNLCSTFNNRGAGGAGFVIMGTKGSIQLGGSKLIFKPENPREGNEWITSAWPKKLEEEYYRDPKIIASEVSPLSFEGGETYTESGPGSTELHLRNFLYFIKTRKQPVQDASAGHHAAACAHMVNLSADKKKFIFWDYDKDVSKS